MHVSGNICYLHVYIYAEETRVSVWVFSRCCGLVPQAKHMQVRCIGTLGCSKVWTWVWMSFSVDVLALWYTGNPFCLSPKWMLGQRAPQPSAGKLIVEYDGRVKGVNCAVSTVNDLRRYLEAALARRRDNFKARTWDDREISTKSIALYSSLSGTQSRHILNALLYALFLGTWAVNAGWWTVTCCLGDNGAFLSKAFHQSERGTRLRCSKRPSPLCLTWYHLFPIITQTMLQPVINPLVRLKTTSLDYD